MRETIINEGSVQRRIDARARAAELIEFIDSEVAAHACVECREIIHYALAKRFPANTHEVVPDKPMSDTESRAFERSRMTFGVHSGKPIADVPMDYLLWLEGEPNFRRELRRYLRSDRIQREQDSP